MFYTGSMLTLKSMKFRFTYSGDAELLLNLLDRKLHELSAECENFIEFSPIDVCMVIPEAVSLSDFVGTLR